MTGKKKVVLGLVLFFLGLLGVLSMFTGELPIPEEAKNILETRFTPFQAKLLLLINPTMMLLVFVTLGTLCFKKVNLSVPIIEQLVGVDKANVPTIVSSGVVGGLLAGILIVCVSYLFNTMISEEMAKVSKGLQPSILMRFLYGGITEEILMRFGFMSLLIWLIHKITNRLNPTVYLIGISLAAFLFALGHFPVLYMALENPSNAVKTFVILGNSIGGFIFGWLYWKKGLESAMIAHMCAHVVMMIGEQFM